MLWFGGKKNVRHSLAAITASETGLVRPDNQDNLYANLEARVFCVADGMGGGSEGATASALVCQHLREANLGDARRTKGAVHTLLASAIHDAHEEIAAYAQKRGFTQMGSTIALLAFEDEGDSKALIGHIGDSRVYRIRHGMTQPLTRDHTLGATLSLFGGSRAKALKSRDNPLAHVLTRAIGTKSDVPLEVEWRTVDVQAGDRFVICSDGVHDVISDARLAVFVGGGDLARARDNLEKEILAQGAPDNYSFILVEVT